MKHNQDSSPSELDLRWQLRQLPKVRDVPESAWQSINKTLDETLQDAQQQRVSYSKKASKSWPIWAFAASLAAVLAIGLPLWLNKPTTTAPNNPQAQMMAHEVDLMSLEYQAALKEMSHAGDQGQLVEDHAQLELKLLDDSAQQIRHAISQNPSATYLLTMLRRTYMQRLQITQRLILS
jgi:hypothetical protein